MPTPRPLTRLVALAGIVALISWPQSSAAGASGSGFLVNDSGLVLTNDHVVAGCTQITADGVAARLRVSSEALDLALLEAPGLAGRPGARFARRPVELNADILAAGFPYSNLLDGLNVTRGSISSVKGSRGSDYDMQITAPVQPGNSGGPVLDAFGRVVGVVEARLDKDLIRQDTGSIPENINFAIRGENVIGFLLENGVAVRTARDRERLPPTALAREAEAITLYIECR